MPSKHEIWKQTAKDIGGRYDGDNVLRYQSGEWEITLDTIASESNWYSGKTRMRAPFVNRDGLYFEIYRTGFFTSIWRFFGMQDIQIDDPYFDDNFTIKGNNEGKIRLLLNDRLKQLIQAQSNIWFRIRDWEGDGTINSLGEFVIAPLPDGVELLSFECFGVVKDEKRLKNLFDLVSITLERLVQIDSAYENAPRVTLA